jgi:hypothetical protein
MVNGYSPNSRGRISQDIKKAYDDAHSVAGKGRLRALAHLFLVRPAVWSVGRSGSSPVSHSLGDALGCQRGLCGWFFPAWRFHAAAVGCVEGVQEARGRPNCGIGG